VACTPAPLVPGDDLTVQTRAGTVHGKLVSTVREFLGIPFAAPPIGERRWKPPQPAACWSDVRDATSYGNACIQILPNQSTIGSEDCLNLNVWAPETGARHLPVMFFIYGGAYILGSGNQDLIFDGTGNLYDGQQFAEQHNVVVVTFNYRLGELGFLAHPALAAEDPNGSSGNYGLLDQIAALKWVQANIASFGGDPTRVMMFGESAGGLSTCLLLATPLAKGLFSSALIESGGCLVGSKASRQMQGQAIQSTVGCGDTDAGDPLACMRALPATDFLVSPPSGFSPFIYTDTERAWEMLYGPNQDGYVFTEPPMESIKAGHGSVVPTIVGSNANEFDLFLAALPINTCLDYAAFVESLFPSAVATQILSMYDCITQFDGNGRYAASAVGTDFMFGCWARRIARAALQGGAPSVHRYWNPHTYTNSPLTLLRAFHASELPFVFGTTSVFGYTPTAGDTNVTSAFQDSWSRFAATGNPNGGSEFTWPLYDQTDPVVVIDDTLSAQVGVDTTNCDYWDSIAEE